MEHLSSKTIKELREYAKDNNVDLHGAKTKTKILSILLDNENLVNVVKADEPVKREPVSSSGSNLDGVVISKPAEAPIKKAIKIDQEENEKVAIHSEKNMRWQGLGQISKGYNIVTKEASEKWTTLKNIRLATPEEVAAYYGKT